MTIGLEHWIPLFLLLTLAWPPVTEPDVTGSVGDEADVDLAVLSSLLIV